MHLYVQIIIYTYIYLFMFMSSIIMSVHLNAFIYLFIYNFFPKCICLFVYLILSLFISLILSHPQRRKYLPIAVRDKQWSRESNQTALSFQLVLVNKFTPAGVELMVWATSAYFQRGYSL